jgi:splicing factor 3B subunit 2
MAQGRHVAEFKHIFEHFTVPNAQPDKYKKEGDYKEQAEEGDAFSKANDQLKKEEEEVKVSKKQKKLMSRMKVFDLKMKVRRPDMVEAWDITAHDPLFLMEMKMVRNSVPVPRHWC